MNTEEKAKAYDEVFERVKPLYEWAKKDDNPMWSTYEYLFPQLAESEDEKIRKFLIDYFTSYKIGNVATKLNGYRIDDILAYLEKQKEPHYTKRNALFDKCVENCDPKTVEEVNKRVDDIMNMPELSAFEQALTNFIGYWEDDEERWPSKFVKKHSKHILDMAREELQKEQKHPNGCFTCDEYKKGYEEGRRNGFTAGYNKAMKEVEQKEQKPAEWSEDIIQKAIKEVGLTQHQIDWFKTNVFPPKQEWSEEDEGELQNAIDALEFLGKKGVYKSESGYDAALQAASWLKLFCLQPKSKWNEDYLEEDIQTRFAFYTYKDDPSTLYLSNVFVEETSRNKGFGTKILMAAENVAETLGTISIRLKVKQDNPANVWYLKHGYNYITSEGDYDWLEKNLKYLKPKKTIKWSGDDELMIESLIAYLKGTGQDFISNDMVYWLKSLPERFNLQPKQEWSEEEKDKLNSIERIIVNANAHGNYLIGDKEAIDLQHFIRSIVKPTTNLAEWSENDKLHYVSVLNALEYVKGCKSDYDKIEAVKSDIAWLRELPERFNLPPKQEWSEEDEKIRKALVWHLKADVDFVSNGVTKAECLAYLDKQKAQKQEWSDEDKRILKGIIGLVDHNQHYNVSNKEMLAWLKSLRPSWKPSEEQMKALLGSEGISRASGYPENAKVLASLYEQLKKLM